MISMGLQGKNLIYFDQQQQKTVLDFSLYHLMYMLRTSVFPFTEFVNHAAIIHVKVCTDKYNLIL